jgi:prepilin-type N-terminal cleavage/methylation domain-containing protein
MKWMRRNNACASARFVVPPLEGSRGPAKAGTTCLCLLGVIGFGGSRAFFAAKSGAERRTPKRAFTLVELLAAMAFMAIVIPVAMEGLRIASRAGQVGQRKSMAARVGDRMLNEYVVMNQRQTGKQNGTAQEGPLEFRWNIRVENWREDSMRLVTCEVTYPVQGKNYSVTESTLVSLTTQ